jgi:hypothetical protein
LHCLEVNASGETISPALDKAIASWNGHDGVVTAKAVAGPQFWMLQEPEWAEELISATVAAAGDGA